MLDVRRCGRRLRVRLLRDGLLRRLTRRRRRRARPARRHYRDDQRGDDPQREPASRRREQSIAQPSQPRLEGRTVPGEGLRQRRRVGRARLGTGRPLELGLLRRIVRRFARRRWVGLVGHRQLGRNAQLAQAGEERVVQLGHAGEAVFLLLRQRAQQDLFVLLRNARLDRSGQRRRRRHLRDQRLGGGRSRKGQPTCRELIHHHAERIDVAAAANLPGPSRRLLGRHVFGRPDQRAGLRQPLRLALGVNQFRNTKIYQLHKVLLTHL